MSGATGARQPRDDAARGFFDVGGRPRHASALSSDARARGFTALPNRPSRGKVPRDGSKVACNLTKVSRGRPEIVYEWAKILCIRAKLGWARENLERLPSSVERQREEVTRVSSRVELRSGKVDSFWSSVELRSGKVDSFWPSKGRRRGKIRCPRSIVDRRRSNLATTWTPVDLFRDELASRRSVLAPLRRPVECMRAEAKYDSMRGSSLRSQAGVARSVVDRLRGDVVSVPRTDVLLRTVVI